MGTDNVPHLRWERTTSKVITPAEAFWALYGALSHPPLRIASKSYTHRSD